MVYGYYFTAIADDNKSLKLWNFVIADVPTITIICY